MRKSKLSSSFRWPISIIVLWIVLAPGALAQDGPTQDQVNQVAKRLFCPVCENTPLDVCPTQACQQWRDVIRTKLDEGQTEEQILEYFANMYGDSVLAEPPPGQLAAWLLPVLIVLVAAGILFYWIHSWTRDSPRGPSIGNSSVEDIDASDPYIIQLEKELSQWK